MKQHRRNTSRLYGWAFKRREGLCMAVCYGLVYGLGLAMTYNDPVAIGGVAFLAMCAAIIGHCITAATEPGAHL